MYKSTLLAILLTLISVSAWAIQVAPIELTLTQPDGFSFQVRPRGDEYAHWMETLEGHSIVLEDGEWYYAARADDGSLEALPYFVGSLTSDELLNIPKHTTPKIDSSLIEEHIPLPLSRPYQGQSTLRSMSSYAHIRPLLVILVDFNDVKFTYSDADESFQRLFFGDNNSVKDYFLETSYGKLEIIPASETYTTDYNGEDDGVIHVTLDMNHPNKLTPDLVKGAFEKANHYIDYASYDKNEDEFITPNELSIILVVAGYEEAYGSLTPHVWAHKSSLGGHVQHDGVKLSPYASIGELHGHERQATIGVMCHELGHLMLGLPDLYDTTYESVGIGRWGLMGSGASNQIGTYAGDKPAHLCAWSKATVNITEPEDIVVSAQEVSILDAGNNPDVKRLWIDPYRVKEYFLLEHRQQLGYDSGLPGEGLLIWHIDDHQCNNDDVNHKLVDLEEADEQDDLDSDANRGDEGDPFPGLTSNTTFSDTTDPNAKDYSGKNTGIEVRNISSSLAAMTADLTPTSRIGDHIRYDENGVRGGRGSIPYPSQTFWTALSMNNSTGMNTLEGFEVYINTETAIVDFHLYSHMSEGTPQCLLHLQEGFEASYGWNRFLLDQPQFWPLGERVMVLKIFSKGISMSWPVYIDTGDPVEGFSRPVFYDGNPPYSNRSFLSPDGVGKYDQLSDESDHPGDLNQIALLGFTTDWETDPNGPGGMEFVDINDSGAGMKDHEGNPISRGGFSGQMSKYETTNAQYCGYLNDALATGDITVSGNDALGANGTQSGTDFVDETYYDGDGDGGGFTSNGVTNGGAVRIHYSEGVFSVDPGFNDHPVTYVSWYGATAFAAYYGYRLPTEWEWQAVADYDGSYWYGCGPTINNAIANYEDSTHPDGTSPVGSFGAYGYGMGDMAGNVWEWTANIYSGSQRAFCGGSWNVDGIYCNVSVRALCDPCLTEGNSIVGFRVCR